MSTITWIIIVLIVISIGVTVGEVLLRFALLEKEKGKGRVVAPKLTAIGTSIAEGNTTRLHQGLSSEEVMKLCGMELVGKTFAELGYC